MEKESSSPEMIIDRQSLVSEPDTFGKMMSSPVVVLQVDDELKAMQIGPFTNKQAEEKLILSILNVLNETQIKLPILFKTYLLKPYILIGMLVVATLIAGYIVTLRVHILFEGVIVFLMLFGNGLLYERNSRRQMTDVWKKLHDFLLKIERFGIGNEEVSFSSNLPTVAISRVIRDGVVKQYPCNLLVQGDIVICGLGEMVPARVKLDHFRHEIILERDTRIKPTHIPPNVKPLEIPELDTKAVFKFVVLETPVENICKASLNSHRPETFASHYVDILETLTIKYLLGFLLSTMIVNITKFYLVPGPSNAYLHFGYQLALVALPLIPAGIPMLMLLTRSYSNAYILTLFDALQTSKTEFIDAEDVDEFDEAPAPTKELTLSKRAIWSTFIDQLISDGVRTSRARGLVEALAYSTVFCAIDREGTITEPIPSIDEILLFKPNGEPIILDLSIEPISKAVRFEDEDWSTYLKTLKPLGLLHMLCTECQLRHSERKELHFKSNRFPAGINTSASRQACQCALGNLIGFQSDVLQRFVIRNVINTWTKSHPSLIGMEDYHYQIPSIHSTIISEPELDSAVQIFSEGSLDLIFESCTDYW